MTGGPWFFRSFSGSWRFDRVGPDLTRVAFTYSLVGRPALITGLLRFVFARETRRRLIALKRAAESQEGCRRFETMPLSEDSVGSG